ncbi:MAG: DNA repair protein RecO [Candidatus Thiodiazotropha lotti]|uniref:DNA repair protein RecO n=1 Tax=Candidatus Thiodiazotropha endoloripes TaxID=1818881 RepID=A0A1E2UT63_9GAMM|nr:DNA repair protein RecO [Candidatus Thiodiazotropha endoloripes]MCG7898561.1 DNA repair protein RecO [Candidatus Thiodiazotropha weberae]MCG7990810.1 DNA repair protein RecO [Candidatus Thiodiazotropha lotti]MCG7901442.1 DNA repair protein RecO [Candidatus Thiodiazotropha weberae]MCG7999326.1 DNA repair protein RecO [Candidatus Thiodiazotropha lotti]MCW4182464.1 DNA repair protein RecO [Candidatus Thiodiazotropha weberae]
MSRINFIPAYVLHRRDYQNSSLLVELFTPNEGRLPAIAKGAKSGRSNKAILLQPFLPLRVSLSGRGEIKSLVEVEQDGQPFKLSGDRIYCGFYLNELIVRLIERGDPFPSLFVHYCQNLAQLASAEPVGQILRQFELQLLTELGYGLLLDHTADSGELIREELLYDYHIEEGPVLSSPGSSGMKIHGSTLIGLHNGDSLAKQSAKEAKQLMRFVLSHYLGDKPLKSRELFTGPSGG